MLVLACSSWPPWPDCEQEYRRALAFPARPPSKISPAEPPAHAVAHRHTQQPLRHSSPRPRPPIARCPNNSLSTAFSTPAGDVSSRTPAPQSSSPRVHAHASPSIRRPLRALADLPSVRSTPRTMYIHTCPPPVAPTMHRLAPLPVHSTWPPPTGEIPVKRMHSAHTAPARRPRGGRTTPPAIARTVRNRAGAICSGRIAMFARRVSPTPETPAQSRASSRWRTCRPRTPYLVLTHHAPDPRRTFNTANPNPSNSEHRTLHVECGYVKTGRKIAACLWRFCLKIRKYGYGRERWSGCVWDARNAMSS
ncbi:hypothetical protein AcW1_004510 [Taiwanofungus camphoratus]|nr:hypothetical protein AcW1_004510 [Antrodia cinnamomea]